jgi:O-methyltransferase involved in polyketide biosynthesis
VFSTLQTIAGLAARGSTLVFDYMDADAFLAEKTGKRIRLMQGIAAQVGEPMKTGLDPLALDGDLRAVGFCLEENLSPAEIDDLFFQGRQDRYRAFEHVHFARAVVA